MQIDWITVGAQIINFLILVWLLQRFLYGPIIRAMDRREQRIAARLDEAEQGKRDAETEAHAYREKQQRLEQQRGELLAQAQASAEQKKIDLEKALRREIDQQRGEWVRQIDAQRTLFLKDVRERTAEHFYGLARKALTDLADTRLEDQMAAVFVDRIRALDGEIRRKIEAACSVAGNTITIQSRFALPPERRREITAAIHETISSGATVTYEENGAACNGIELKAGSQTIAWTIDNYLDGLEQAIGEEISALAGSPAEAAAV
ncbi:MAG: F0F1 ATP synthase subunit B [Alphaproteobacteria bacterium]|nr:F0F1 ATP synthase subunit B [Alphaproteobacteria bacterium]